MCDAPVVRMNEKHGVKEPMDIGDKMVSSSALSSSTTNRTSDRKLTSFDTNRGDNVVIDGSDTVLFNRNSEYVAQVDVAISKKRSHETVEMSETCTDSEKASSGDEEEWVMNKKQCRKHSSDDSDCIAGDNRNHNFSREQIDEEYSCREYETDYGSEYESDGYTSEEDEYITFNESKLRTLKIRYWSRTQECKERKWDHMDMLDEKREELGITREDHILSTTLKGRSIHFERNMFPYDTPVDIEHWTLWGVNEMKEREIEDYVYQWIHSKDIPLAGKVVEWNYDDNPERSINLFHVHVYLRIRQG